MAIPTLILSMANTITRISAQVHEVLKLVGFKRRGNAWNRASGDFIDVINIQTSKSLTISIAVNVGVLDSKVHEVFAETQLPKVVPEYLCTVRSRLGMLMTGRDIWWNTSDPEVDTMIAESIRNFAVPFTDGLHTRAAIIEKLAEQLKVQRTDVATEAKMAILLHIIGRLKESNQLLQILKTRKTSDLWQQRIEKISERLAHRA